MTNGKKTIGIGLVGCGAISETHVKSYLDIEGVRLVAVSDVNGAAAEKMAGKYGCLFHADYREMIDRDPIDAVDICTPSGLRRDIAQYAVERKKQVIAEKPIEVTTQRIDEMLEAAQRNGVRIHGIFNTRYKDIYLWLRSFLEAGGLGDLVFCDIAMKWYRPPEYYRGSWRGTWALDGGGALMNQCIHFVDLMQLFMGRPSSVCGSIGRLVHKGLEAEDTAAAILKYPNGAMGIIQASTALNPGFSTRFCVHGQKGGIIIEDDVVKDMKVAGLSPEDEKRAEPFRKPTVVNRESAMTNVVSDYELHRRQLTEIVDAIRENRESQVSGREARKAVEIITGIYRSARERREIEL